MSCLSWRHIFHESWENKSKFQIGGLRETGGLPLFSPEGRTYSPPRRHKLHILRPAASGRSHPFRCASFSHKVSDFVGALLRRWYCLRQPCALRGGCGCCGSLQTMPQHLRVLLPSSAQTAIPCDERSETGVDILYPCCRLPAQTCHRQLCRREGYHDAL